MSVTIPLNYNAKIIVKSKEQLAGKLSSNILYEIDGEIDMQNISIKIPSSGLAIYSPNPEINRLISSADNFTLFVAEDPIAGAGGVNFSGISIYVTGTNSQVFNVDNTNDGSTDEFSLISCNFYDCTSLGYVAGYRQGLWDNVGIINCQDGIELDKNWSGGFRATTSIVIGFATGGTVFKAGATLVFNNRFLTDMNFTIPVGATAIDFTPANFANDNTFIVRDASFVGGGSYIPNTPASDDVAKFTNNVGITNTYIGGVWSLTTETATTIATASTPVKIAGTTNYTDLEHFTSNGNNALEKTTQQPVQISISADLSFTGSNGDVVVVYVYKWDNSAGSYTEVKRTGGDTVNASNRAEGVNLTATTSMDYLDRIELWCSNETAGRDLTLGQFSDCRISER